MDEECTVLTSYLAERQRAEGVPSGEALTGLYARRRTVTSILLRGIEGQQSRVGRSFPQAAGSALTAIAIGTRPDTASSPAIAGAGMTAQFKLTVYTSEAARHDGHPVHRAIIQSLNSAGISGATTVRGIWGYHGDHAPHGEHFPRQAHHVPVVTTVIAAAEQVSAAFDAIDPHTAERGLVTAETVLAARPRADAPSPA